MKSGAPDGKKSSPLVLSGEQSRVNEIERLRAEVDRLQALVRELDKLAHLDPLVLLPNRRGFLRDLEKLVSVLDRYGGMASMIFVDVDRLKQINDRFGHQIGDAALVRVAETLVATVRASDSVARLSGDEFAVLLPNTDELGAWNMALRIDEATFASGLNVGETTLSFSVAVGVASIQAGDQPNDVIGRADKAMYRIKAA